MSESEIILFIRQTEQDLALAKSFLSMWRRRNAPQSPAMSPQNAQEQLIPEANGVMEKGNYGATKQALLKAIEKCPSEYTVFDVEKALVEMGTPLERPQIQQGVSRLARRKEINLVRKGAGRSPAVYKK